MKGFCGGRNLLMFQKARKQTLDRKWDQGLHCKAHIYTYLFQLSSITQYFFFYNLPNIAIIWGPSVQTHDYAPDI